MPMLTPLVLDLTVYGYDEKSIIPLATGKLNPTSKFAHDQFAQLAYLAIRIGFDFDASREIDLEKEAQAVKSYMRVVFAVPAHREFMRTGTPSEPILAEAAACLLNDVHHARNMALGELAPTVLNNAFQNGFLVGGERGEMIARLLWTMAHDEAVRRPTPFLPQVMEFLHSDQQFGTPTVATVRTVD